MGGVRLIVVDDYGHEKYVELGGGLTEDKQEAHIFQSTDEVIRFRLTLKALGYKSKSEPT